MAEFFKLGGDVQGSGGFLVGDRLGRAFHSFGAFLQLLALKVRKPALIAHVNGNHKNRHITQVFGVYDECSSKYCTSAICRCCTDVFDFLTFSALVDGMAPCVHGGLSPSIRTLNRIRAVQRMQEVSPAGPKCDLPWSDPEEIGDCRLSPVGCYYVSRSDAASELNCTNNLDFICLVLELTTAGFQGTSRRSRSPFSRDHCILLFLQQYHCRLEAPLKTVLTTSTTRPYEIRRGNPVKTD
ncbi:hypothetical protein HPB48_009779 [Haemaphysalis longicornis]|uniref:protein-serine/threonine phosphatase n=1 Tax=Haemaphysalis longicornis TaxID=44386 RepID=A0A9J6GNP1_HAELO|nr:hypothetical protein HPB48_009779 [Haemaphysalis longicornis]